MVPGMSALLSRLVKLAHDQVGYHEGRAADGHWDNQNKYAKIAGQPNGQAWCATFVYALGVMVGAPGLFPNTASCDVAAAWHRKRGRWHTSPAIGDQVFYGTAADLTHTGLVVGFDRDYLYTVEGNTNLTGAREGDGVYDKKRLRASSNIVGFGRPAYPVDAPKPTPALDRAVDDLTVARDRRKPGAVRRAIRVALRAARLARKQARS
jgi:hypothetical protein